MSRRPARRAAARAELAAAATTTKAASKTHGKVVPDLSLYSQFTRIGGGLTPQQVSKIIREADSGQMARLMDLGNEARQKDCHLHSVLATSEEAIVALPWELELPDKPKAKEKRAAAKVEKALREAKLARLIAHHAGARFYGYAVSEIDWRFASGFVGPRSFDHLAPRRFGFRQTDGAFVWRDDGMPLEGVDFRRDHPRKFIVSQPRVTGDVPCREGLIRVLMWAALFRNWAIGDLLKVGEIAWKPWRRGIYKKGASQEDINHLTAILEGLTTNGVATYSEEVQVLIEWAKGSGGGQGKGPHESLISMMAAEMSKAALGQTLTTEVGSTGGNRALGQVQNEQKKDLREASVRYIADDLNRDLVVPMFDMNFGPGIRPSKFKLLTDDAADVVQLSTAVKTFVDAGLTLPAKWVRDQAGIPDPEEDEETIGGTPKPAETEKPKPGAVGDKPSDEDSEADDDDAGEEDPPVDEAEE